MAASMPQHLMRGRHEYGPLCGYGRMFVLNCTDMINGLALGRCATISSTPGGCACDSRKFEHYAIAGELHAKNNDIVAVCARRRGQGKTIQMAEAHLRNTETQLVSEPQQRDLAMSGAKEVNAGIAEVFQQYERAHVEQTAERWSHDHCTS